MIKRFLNYIKITKDKLSDYIKNKNNVFIPTYRLIEINKNNLFLLEK